MPHAKNHRRQKPGAKTKPRQKQKPAESKNFAIFERYFLPVVLILFLPFVYSYKTLDMNAAPRLLLVSLTVIVFAIHNLFKSNKQNCHYGFLWLTFFPAALFYIVWTLVTLLFAVNPGEGTFDVAKSFLTLGLLIYLTQYFLTQNKAVDTAVKSVIISAVIATAVGLFQYITKVHGKTEYDIYMSLYAVKGLMAHKNQFAVSLLLMLPFATYGLFTLKRYWRAAAAYAILMILIDITIIQTRSVWIATLFFLLVFSVLGLVFLMNNNLKELLIKNRKILLSSFIALIVIAITAVVILKRSGTSGLMKEQVTSTFSTKSTNAQWRLKMWNASWQLAKDNLWLGVGAGNWKNAVIPYYHLNFGGKYQNWRRPHNDFLWVLTEKGILGLLIFLLLFGLIFYYGFKILFNEPDKNKRLLTLLMISGIMGYLIASVFTFPLERVNHQVYLAFMSALVISEYYKNHQRKKNKKGLFLWVNLAIMLATTFSLYYSYLYLESEIYIKKARSALNQNKLYKVINYTDKAYSPYTKLDYTNLPIKMYQGVAELRLKKYKKAYDDFKIALNDFPNNVSVLNNIAIAATELGKYKEAIAYLEKSIFLYPHNEESLSNMVIVYYRSKDYEKAYQVLLNQDTRNPNKQYLYFKRELENILNTSNQKKRP